VIEISPTISPREVIDPPWRACDFRSAVSKEKEAIMLRSFSRENIPIRHHAELKGFKLALPATVEGPDAEGSFFREETVLSQMSHVGAIFTIANPVSLGTRLKLSVSLPPKLSQGKSLKLVVKGTIAAIEPSCGDNNHSQVSLRLENRYIIQNDSLETV
jgi:hypothetical protein